MGASVLVKTCNRPSKSSISPVSAFCIYQWYIACAPRPPKCEIIVYFLGCGFLQFFWTLTDRFFGLKLKFIRFNWWASKNFLILSFCGKPDIFSPQIDDERFFVDWKQMPFYLFIYLPLNFYLIIYGKLLSGFYQFKIYEFVTFNKKKRQDLHNEKNIYNLNDLVLRMIWQKTFCKCYKLGNLKILIVLPLC